MFDDSNGKNQNTTASIDWDLLLANLYYEYNINEFIDGSGDSLSKATTHYGRFETNGRFWSDRIGYNLTQQYRETTTEFGSGGLEEDADGFFRIPVEGLVSYLRTTTALAPDPVIEDVNLTNKPELSDRILDDIDTNSVPPVEPLQTGHFGFTPFDPQPINRLFLYLDRFSANQFDPDELPGLTWQIYTKDPIDTFWLPEIPDVPFTYNTDLGRFELSFATINGPEFLIVVTNPSSGTELVFTELEAFRLAATEDGTTISEVKSTSYQTNIGARYRITETLMTSFTFNYDHGDDKNGGDTVREYDRTTWSGRMSWSPVPYVTPSIGYSENREENTGQDDRLNRLYSVTVSTRPLPSVNFSLGYTHNDRYEDKDKTYKADTYSLFAKASIYPDLSVSLNNSYSVTDTLDRASAEGSFVNNKTLTSRLDITARLHRYLTAFGTGNYSTTDNEETGKRENANATFTLSFRPSDLLSLSSSYAAFFLDDERSNAFTATMELYLLRTNKSRVSLLANHIQADETSDSFRVIGSWDISDYFSFTGNGSYNMNPTRDTYAFYLSLAMRL